MPVYTSAAADGLTVLDGDVRWSSTGYPYMLHNADMGLFGHASVDLADISGTTASSYRATDGSQIASLYQVSQLLQLNPGVGLEVELKTTLTEAQWAMLATRLDPIRGMTTVTSFSLATVRAAQDHGYRTAYLVSAPTSSTAAPVVDQDYPTITRAEVLKLAAVGVNVEAWTPNTVSEWNALADLGVTAINTDDPRACVTWAAGR
jgi:glycerophosphoryl diester phosphodiesterase